MAFWNRKPQPQPAGTEITQPERRHFIRRIAAFTAGGAVAVGAGRAAAATTGLDPFLGEIALVPYTFPPKGWAFCDGQILSIAQNTALFSLLGTNFGGNGQTTFALPDLRGRVPIHAGQGPGLSSHDLGEMGGVEDVTLNVNQIPAHNHVLNASSLNGTSDAPTGGIPAKNASGVPDYGTTPNATMAANAIGAAGGNQPHYNMPPYLGLHYIIALQGIFPSQNAPAQAGQ